MLNFILRHLFKIAVKIISKKLNLSSDIELSVNTLFDKKLDNQKLDVKTDKNALIKNLLQASSKQEADQIRQILKEKDDKNHFFEKIVSLCILIFAIIYPFYAKSDELIGSIFVSAIIIFALIKYGKYKIENFYQCTYCFTTQKLSEYQIISYDYKNSSQKFETQNRYTGHDNFFNYYTTDTYQTTTHHYDRKSKCPCCGYEQIIPIKRSHTSQI